MSRTHLMLDIPTNLILDPEDFVDPDSAWNFTSGMTGEDNTDTAPDGSMTADTITADTTEPYTDNVTQDVTITPKNNAPYTFSVHIKKEDDDNVRLFLYLFDTTTSTTHERLYFQINLEDGSTYELGSVITSGGPGYSQEDVTVESVGDYWRVGFTLVDYSGLSNLWRIRIYPRPQASGQPVRTIVLWGAQLVNRNIIYPYFNSVEDVAGDQFNLQMLEDESGAVQYAIIDGSCTDVELQGRLSADLGWMKIASSGALNSSDNNVVQTNVAILPQMRAVMKGPTIDRELYVYLME